MNDSIYGVVYDPQIWNLGYIKIIKKELNNIVTRSFNFTWM